MPGRTPRWLRRLLLSAAAFTAAVVTLAAVVFLLLQTQTGKRLVAERLETELAAATGFDVRMGGIEGALPCSATVTDVRIGDTGGTWLAVDRLAIDWRPMDLLHGRLHVTDFSAGTIALTHLPVAPETKRETQGIDLAIALPRLPLPTTVDALRVGRIVVAPGVLGEAAVFDLNGRAELGGAAR